MEKIIDSYHSLDKLLAKNRKISMVFVGAGLFTFLIAAGIVLKVSQQDMLAVDKDGDVVSLTRTSSADKFLIEADNHIRLLYSRFFSYDKSNIKEQVELGLVLGDQSLINLYETYDDMNWYSVVVNNDLISESYVVGNIDMRSVENGVFFSSKGVQKITRGELIEFRNLHLEGYIIEHEVGRIKFKNPHGMKIVDLVLIDNATIKDEE